MRIGIILSILAVATIAFSGAAVADQPLQTVAGLSVEAMTDAELAAVVAASGGIQAYPQNGVHGQACRGRAVCSFVNNQGTQIADVEANYHANNPGNTSLGD